MKRLVFFVTAVMVAGSVFLVPKALAQDEASPSAQVESVQERLDKDYFFQLEKYRDAEKDFNLRRAEYKKLGTLASQEDAVASMKVVMEARAKTLGVYLISMEKRLTDAFSIDVGQKQQALDKSYAARNYLQSFLVGLPSKQDKQEVTDYSQKFEKDVGVVFEVEYRILSLLNMGKLQGVTDQLLIDAKEFEKNNLNTIEDLNKQAAATRGLKEVTGLYEDAKSAITQATSEYKRYDVKGEYQTTNYEDVFNEVSGKLQPAFSSLQRAVNYLLELAKGY
jgi:hypothetical protein